MVKTFEQQSPQNNLQKKAGELKGVRKRKWGKWVSEVRMPKSRAKIWLGSYDTSEQAARAYDCAVYCLRGSNAKFNFPDSLPEIQSSSSLSPAQIQAVAAKFAREEFRQSADEYSLTSTCDSECSTGSSKNEEQEEWMLLFDSLLEDMDRNPNFDFENLPVIEYTDFLPPEEEFLSGRWKTH